MQFKTAARAAFLLLAVSLLVVAVVHEGDAILDSLGRLAPLRVAASALAVGLGLVAQQRSWRALFTGSDAGELPLRVAARIFFLGQLGKYVPGSIWTVVAQAELGRDYKISRQHSAVVALGAIAVQAVTGSAIGAAGLAVGSAEMLHTYWWALLTIPMGCVALWPPILNRLVAGALRVTRRANRVPDLTGQGLARSAAWAVAMWAAFGLHAWLIAVDLGASGWLDAATVVGAFALAWVVGLLIVFAPAGAGAREAALVLGLASIMAAPEALVLALVSRVLMIVGDVVAAALSARGRASTPAAAPTPNGG